MYWLLVRQSLFILYEGPPQPTVEKAFDWLINYPTKGGFVAVMVYESLKGVISDVIGEKNVGILRETGRLKLSKKEIKLVTERKLIYDGQNLPLVAFWPTPKFLDKLDSIPNVAAMLVVHWNIEEIRPWIKIWDAAELGTIPQPRREPLVSNPVVVEALKTLTASVNVSTGILHPSDHKLAIEIFEILREGGEDYDPLEVKAWLIREGKWKATHAQTVAELSQKILDGKKMRKGERVLRRDILTGWREEARKSESRDS